MIKLDRVMKEDNATKIGVFVVGFVGILNGFIRINTLCLLTNTSSKI